MQGEKIVQYQSVLSPFVMVADIFQMLATVRIGESSDTFSYDDFRVAFFALSETDFRTDIQTPVFGVRHFEIAKHIIIYPTGQHVVVGGFSVGDEGVEFHCDFLFLAKNLRAVRIRGFIRVEVTKKIVCSDA